MRWDKHLSPRYKVRFTTARLTFLTFRSPLRDVIGRKTVVTHFRLSSFLASEVATTPPRRWQLRCMSRKRKGGLLLPTEILVGAGSIAARSAGRSMQRPGGAGTGSHHQVARA